MAERPLIVIPIIHTKADMGSIRGKVPFDERCQKAATFYWEKIFDYLKNWSGDFSKLRVYQDGLPDTTPELVERIVAETQSKNYEILRWLKSKGASIMGTEGPASLEEYCSLQAIANAADEESRQAALREYRRKQGLLSEGRDQYIGRRINSTLLEGETGLLFLGLRHKVAGYLDQDVKPSRPETLENSLLELLLAVERELEGPAYIGKERV